MEMNKKVSVSREEVLHTENRTKRRDCTAFIQPREKVNAQHPGEAITDFLILFKVLNLSAFMPALSYVMFRLNHWEPENLIPFIVYSLV